MKQREVLTEVARTGASVTKVRSTLLASSLQSLQEHGLGDAYRAVLPTEHQHIFTETVAMGWLPVDLAVAHYRACDTLGLTPQQIREVGASVGMRVQGSFLGTVARGAARAALTPWTLLARGDRVWERVFVGGGTTVYRDGPKDASVDIFDIPLCPSPYFRIGFSGVFQQGLAAVCRSMQVRTQWQERDPHQMTLRISWA
ncbi:MAG: hypothetical protein MO852_15755 [Candidatus Devosia euplotis]|nr:hypothetical protein [Candidatus Devosia euplotis]